MASMSPWQRPGRRMRSVPSGTSSARAIHSVVMRAATVMCMTATSYANPASIPARVCRSAGSASRPVTDSTREGAAERSTAMPRALELLRVAGAHELVRRAFQGPSRGAPEHRVLDLARELEVLVRDAAGRVVLQLDPHLGPGDGEIRMMIGGLGEEADTVHEHERRGPPVGLVLAPDPAVFIVPAGQALQALGDLVVGKGAFRGCHGESPRSRQTVSTSRSRRPRAASVP